MSIVGIGPGALEHLSQKARQALAECDVVAGYATYIRLLGSLTAGKEIISSGMRGEISRAARAIERAFLGKAVCIVSSGDPGIYGMAGLVLELLKEKECGMLPIEIIPGITAASACASLLGAPLAQDFAVISLSDILIPAKEIEAKLAAAAKADFAIVLYNPKSKHRTKPLKMAWKILKKYRPPLTPVGIVRNAYRACQQVETMSLKDAAALKAGIDMATTVIVGSSRTFIKNRFMVTPRGYDVNSIL